MREVEDDQVRIDFDSQRIQGKQKRQKQLAVFTQKITWCFS